MKYKLLKDLPWAKAGKIYEAYDTRMQNEIVLMDKDEHLHSFPLATFSDWFEEVDERWKPEELEEFFFVQSNGWISKYGWCGDKASETTYLFGNCFRTRELAERAAEQIKALLKEFHRNNP